MMQGTTGTGPPGIGLLSKLIRFVLIVVIATVFGPPIGGVAVYLVWALWIGLPVFAVIELGWLSIVTFSYLLGGMIAFLAGTIVALAALWRQPTLPLIIAATTVASLGFELAVGHGAHDRLLVSLAASAFAGTVCWLLLGRLLRI
jgi:hypothetical protein